MRLLELKTPVFIEGIPGDKLRTKAIYRFDSQAYYSLPLEEQEAVGKRAVNLSGWAADLGAKCNGVSEEIILSGEPQRDIPHKGEHFIAGLAGATVMELLRKRVIVSHEEEIIIEGRTFFGEGERKDIGFIRLTSSDFVPPTILQTALESGLEIFDGAISKQEAFEILVKKALDYGEETKTEMMGL